MPGKIHSQNIEGCLAEIGDVIASMRKETLKALTDAYSDIQSKRLDVTAKRVVPCVWPAHVWTAIELALERNVFSLNLRGICWEVRPEILEFFVHDGALPFPANAERSCNAF